MNRIFFVLSYLKNKLMVADSLCVPPRSLRSLRQKIPSRRRRCFTLVEILLSMALFALIIGAVAFNIRYIVGQQRFQNEVNVITETLNRAQQLMLIYGKPMKVKFTVVNKGIQTHIESDCLLDPTWEKWALKSSKVLHEIHSINFKDLNYNEGNPTERVLYFLPNGGNISKGVMEISSAKTTEVKGSYNAYICLPGYPKNLRSTDIKPENCFENIDPQIGIATKNEVLERVVNFE